jgi:hypothetical protein
MGFITREIKRKSRMKRNTRHCFVCLCLGSNERSGEEPYGILSLL